MQSAAAAVIAVVIEGVLELNLGDTEVLTIFLAAVATENAGRRHIFPWEPIAMP